jgi:hypothetical protein
MSANILLDNLPHNGLQMLVHLQMRRVMLLSNDIVLLIRLDPRDERFGTRGN